MAESAVQLTQGTSSAALDTLARLQFMLGEKEDAISTEEKAADVEQNKWEKDGLEKTLASYKEGKLPAADE
jgi:Flp pilus assembly protein TadD